MERNTEIDGIRGWAALLVVMFHLFQEIFGRVFPFLHGTGFGFVFDGHLMVLIFFVLSGDALSISFFRENKIASTVRLAIARYFRLTFPIIVTCTAVYILMSFSLTYNIQAAPFVGRQDWLGSFINFQPSIVGLINYSFADVFFNHKVENSYNPFLWTMSIELLGSIIVFLNIFLFNHLKNPVVVLFTQFAFFFIFSPYYSLFIFGMLLGYARSIGYLNRLKELKWNVLFGLAFFLIIVFISVFREGNVMFLGHTFTRLIQTERLHMLWAMLLVFLVYTSPSLLNLFRSKLSVFLGEISFPIYVVQFIVIVSFTSYGIVRLQGSNLINTGFSLLLAGTSLVMCIVLAYFFRGIERKILKAINELISKKVLKLAGSET